MQARDFGISDAVGAARRPRKATAPPQGGSPTFPGTAPITSSSSGDDSPTSIIPRPRNKEPGTPAPADELRHECLASLLPQLHAMVGRGRRLAAAPAEMASAITGSHGSLNSENQHIPLVCTVCPGAPHFSDVSHLLTHIASKGHLHQETQTKLKAHQDISSSIALQQYEQWYTGNGIEGLLVERMKAKQVKEATRTRCGRGSSTATPAKTKRKPKRNDSGTAIKLEQDDFSSDYPLFPGLFQNDNESEAIDEHTINHDMLALKGQVWPGMGKMDLANDEMRRTRNQRKPMSVIDKMRKGSEGIEPTQVIMTSGFEVERVKGVYDDSSSPMPGQEEATPPRKAFRPKRRKPEPLMEISTNIARANTRSTGRCNTSNAGRAAKVKSKAGNEQNIDPGTAAPRRSLRHRHDVFRDDDQTSSTSAFPRIPTSLTTQGSFEDRSYSTPTQSENRFEFRDRLTMPHLNPILEHNLESPTSPSREMMTRFYAGRDASRGMMRSPAYLSPFNNAEAAYALNDATIYNASARLPFTATSKFSDMGQEHYHVPPGSQAQLKQEEHNNSASADHLHYSGGSQYLTIPGVNPLFSHNRLFSNSLHQSTPTPILPPLVFTPLNRCKEHNHNSYETDQESPKSHSIKLEQQLCEPAEHTDLDEREEPEFASNGIWLSPVLNNDMDLHDGLDPEELYI